MTNAVFFCREKEDVNPVSIEGFTECVSTMLRGVRVYIAYALIMVPVIASMPILPSEDTVLGKVKEFNS